MTTLTYVVGADKHVVEAPGDGALTIIATPEVFAQLTAGELDPVVAYMQGAVKITGDQAALYELLPDIPVPKP